ncbi:MAG: hypothetical protein IRZ09_01880 [Variibacter sp.]|nr:hypothetical protein [Variibacter sp.]
MTEETSALPAVPMVDVRAGGALRHALEGRAEALALRDDCLSVFPRGTVAAMPLLDRLARRWLVRSRAPYVAEIETMARALGFAGVWFLNGSYQWGCTSLAREEEGALWLVRTLDWPFPGLGRRVAVARMRGPAGEFFSVTWPGYVGALTAMAPGRFAACINQAPLRRRTRHPWLRLCDMAANAANTWIHVRHMPPDQLLRLVFETCGDFAAARKALERTPVARPVIYTLIGCAPGERCVIERTEEAYETRCDDTAAANDWGARRPGWEARIAARHFFTLSFAEAAENSRARRAALAAWPGPIAGDDFDWVAPPVLNPYTRVAVAMSAARAVLRVAGYEMTPAHALPQRATQASSFGPNVSPPAGRRRCDRAAAVS